jgi:hypothetical protein
MYKYNFTEEELSKCKSFAESIDTSFYATRNQFNPEKRKTDQIIGKLGEILTYNYLLDKVQNLTYPDFNIYEKSKKSWDFDLKGNDSNIHVKSQNIVQAKNYGQSWIFQAGNGKNKNYDKEIFDQISPNQYVSFCLIDLGNKCGEIKSILKLSTLHDNKLFKLPKLEKLQVANKLAVYFSDIKVFENSYKG